VKRKQTALPKWVWALPIAALVLLSIVWFSPKEEENYFIDLTNLNCDEMVEAHAHCIVNVDVQSDCRDYYVNAIVDCYGEEVLRDQLALENSTVI